MMEQIGGFITLLLTAIITAALPILLKFTVDWLMAKVAQAQTRLAEQQQDLIKHGIRMVVAAAEQSGLWDAALATGKAKKDYAIDTAQAWLASVGLELDMQSLDALIESIVHEFNEERDWSDAGSALPAVEEGEIWEPTASTTTPRGPIRVSPGPSPRKPIPVEPPPPKPPFVDEANGLKY